MYILCILGYDSFKQSNLVMTIEEASCSCNIFYLLRTTYSLCDSNYHYVSNVELDLDSPH